MLGRCLLVAVQALLHILAPSKLAVALREVIFWGPPHCLSTVKEGSHDGSKDRGIFAVGMPGVEEPTRFP